MSPYFAESLSRIELYRQHGLATPARIRELELFVSLFEDRWDLTVSRTPEGYPAVSYEDSTGAYDGVEAIFIDDRWVIEWDLGNCEERIEVRGYTLAAAIFLTVAQSIY